MAMVAACIAFFLFADPANAQVIKLEVPLPQLQEIYEPDQALVIWVVAIYEFVVGAIGVIAAVMIMYNGMKWATAAGNSSTIENAKEGIISAITGLVIALTSYIILGFINPAFVEPGPLDFPESDFLEAFEAATGGTYCINGCSVDDADISTFVRDAAPCSKYDQGHGATISAQEIANAINANRGAASPVFITTIMKIESGGTFCTNAKSNFTLSNGSEYHACGISQIIPSTARGWGGACGFSGTGWTQDDDPDVWSAADDEVCWDLMDNPEKALCITGKILNNSHNAYSGDEVKMAAAYNGGGRALQEAPECPGLPRWQCEAYTGYEETRNYVKKASTYKDELCVNPYGGTVQQTCSAVEEEAGDQGELLENGEDCAKDSDCQSGVCHTVGKVCYHGMDSWLTDADPSNDAYEIGCANSNSNCVPSYRCGGDNYCRPAQDGDSCSDDTECNGPGFDLFCVDHGDAIGKSCREGLEDDYCDDVDDCRNDLNFVCCDHTTPATTSPSECPTKWRCFQP